MNKTFKVIFSKARNALMVVNEATGSVQAKGTKTVIATAIATALMASGSAMAVTTQGPGAAAVSFDGQQLIKAENTEATVNIDFKDGVITVNELSGWSTPTGSGQGALNNLYHTNSDQVADKAMIVKGGEGGVFSGNHSNNRGGAMTIFQNQATEQLKHQVSGITFEKNSAIADGGAIAFEKYGQEGPDGSTKVAAELTNNTFKENSAKNGGAALLENADVTFGASTFEGNKATMYGGAIYGDTDSIINVTEDSVFKDNSAASGGAILSWAGQLSVDGAAFRDNHATTEDLSKNGTGGAIAIYRDNKKEHNFSITNSEFVGNTATRKGGAIAWLTMDTPDGHENSQTLVISQSSFEKNQAKHGGALYISHKTQISGATKFIENTASSKDHEGMGGAIYVDGTYEEGKLIIADGSAQEHVQFIDNSATVENKVYLSSTQGGAIYNSEKGVISIGAYTEFTGNSAVVGGAIANHSTQETNVIGDHVSFKNNTAQWAGAIFNQNGNLSIGDYATFQGNKSTDSLTGSTVTANDYGDSGLGGAILTENGHFTIGKNAQFINNEAQNSSGGAIANFVHEGHDQTESSLTIGDGAVFTGNKAAINGGAVYNNGEMSIGDATFSDNWASDKLNDIHNDGSLEVNGNLSLDGGITGEGTTHFLAESALNVKVGMNQGQSTTITNTVVVDDGAELNFTFAPGYVGEYQLFTGDVQGEFNVDLNNNVFDITVNKDGEFVVSQKSAEDIAKATGANYNQAAALRAIMSDFSGTNETFDTIAESVALGIQSSNASDRQAALDAVTALSTEAAPVIAQTQTDTATQVYAAVGSRFELTNTQEPGSNLWVQGLFSTGDYDDNGTAKGYDTDSNGIAFGLDSAVTDSVKVGVGFAYTDTDIDGFLRDTDVETKTAFIYGQYKPSNWYVNGIMSYGWSSYDESKHVAGFNVGADYDVETFGLQAMTGYDFEVAGINVTPEAGLRYFRISQDGYTDAAGSTVGSEDNDVLTAVVGAKVNKALEVSPSVVIKPQARLAMTYDLVDADNNSVITLANGATYRVEGETMDRFGVEVDVGVAAEVTDNFEFALTYSGNFRGDFQNHAGLINAKYKF